MEDSSSEMEEGKAVPSNWEGPGGYFPKSGPEPNSPRSLSLSIWYLGCGS